MRLDPMEVVGLSDGRGVSMKRWLAFSLVVGAVAFPAAVSAATFKGVVVSVQAARHAMAIAQPNGVVRTVHARVLREGGTRVTITASRLRNGTFSAARVDALGRATMARIHGIVVRAVRGGYLVSAGGSVLWILSPTRHTAVAGQTPLAPGTPVNATVAIGNDGLPADDIEQAEPGETEPAEPVEPVEPVDNAQGDDQQGDVNDDDDAATTAPPATTTTDQNRGPGSTTSADPVDDAGSTSGGGTDGGDG